VSRYAGAEAVGYAALAIRIADQLSFVKQVAWRLSIAALSRLQRNRERLSKAVTEGMSFQIIAVGPFLTGFGLVAPWILPLFFGPRWLPVLEVYPFIALSYLTNAMFTLHSSALYVLQRNWKVAIFHLVYISLFFGSALLLVPRLGVEGYGWAAVAAFPAYIVLHHFFTVYIGKPGYHLAAIWFIASALPLFSTQLGYWTWVSIIVPFVLPVTRRELLRTVAVILRRKDYAP